MNVGIIVRGKPNTEYSLTATTEAPMFKRQKQNLLRVSEKTEAIKAKEKGGYNYLFTSEKKKITFIPADGKTSLRIKRAYLVSPNKQESITIERRQNNGNATAK